LPLAATLLPVQGVENKRCYELNEEEINKIREEVGKYTTEADLVRAPPPQPYSSHACFLMLHTAACCMCLFNRCPAPSRSLLEAEEQLFDWQM
jgi:hypothetical protein